MVSAHDLIAPGEDRSMSQHIEDFLHAGGVQASPDAVLVSELRKDIRAFDADAGNT